MMAPLVLLLVLGILQLSLTLWVKTTLIDAAGAAAHAAAAVGANTGVAEDTARSLLSSTVGREFVRAVEVRRVSVATVSNVLGSSKVEVVQVALSAPIPILGLFGAGNLKVVGHAPLEVGW